MKIGSAPAIEGVLFDAAGTLLDLCPSMAERVTEVLAPWSIKVDSDRLTRFLQAEATWPDDVDDPGQSEAQWTDFFRRLLRPLCAEFRRPSESEQIEIAHGLVEQTLEIRNYALYPDVGDCLDQLSQRVLPIGIVSNFDTWLGEVLVNLGVRGRLDCLVISAAEGHSKPDPQMFLAGAAGLGKNPEEILFVGDSPGSDIEGALAVGMQAVLIDRFAAFPAFGGARIEGLAEIPDLLQALATNNAQR